MTDTLVGTPDRDPELEKLLDEEEAIARAVAEDYDPFPEPDWVDDEVFVDWVDPNPAKRVDGFPRFIVTAERDFDERCLDPTPLYAVRGRAVALLWADDETPHYGEPLLWGDEGWCKHAAAALNETMGP